MKYFLPALLCVTLLSAQDPKFKALITAASTKYATKSYKLAFADYDNALKIIATDLDKMVAAKQQAGPDQKDWLDALVKHARCAYYISNLTAANADAEKLLAIDSANADARAIKAFAVFKGGNKQDACRAIRAQQQKGCEMAARMFDDCFCWAEGVNYFRDANSAFSLSKNELALENINKAIEILPDSLTYYIKKGQILAKMEKYADAIKTYTYVIDKDKKYFNAWYLRGLANLKSEKSDSAFKDLSECLKLNPYSYDAYLTRSEICQEMKEYQSAIYDLHECIRLKPDNAELHYKVAMIKRDDIQDALGGCEEFIKAAKMGYEDAKPYAEECLHPKKKK